MRGSCARPTSSSFQTSDHESGINLLTQLSARKGILVFLQWDQLFLSCAAALTYKSVSWPTNLFLQNVQTLKHISPSRSLVIELRLSGWSGLRLSDPNTAHMSIKHILHQETKCYSLIFWLWWNDTACLVKEVQGDTMQTLLVFDSTHTHTSVIFSWNKHHQSALVPLCV